MIESCWAQFFQVAHFYNVWTVLIVFSQSMELMMIGDEQIDRKRGRGMKKRLNGCKGIRVIRVEHKRSIWFIVDCFRFSNLII